MFMPMPHRVAPTSWPRIAGALVALLALNALLSFGPWWPTPGVVPQARLAPEMVAVWLGLLALAARRQSPSPRLLWLLAAGVLVLVLGRYADVTAPSLFGRPISLYWDVPQVPRFLWVTARSQPWWASVLAAAVVLALGWALLALIRGCLALVLRHLAPRALRSVWAWVAAFAAALLAAAHMAGVPGTGRYATHAVLPTYMQQLRLLLDAHWPGRLAYALPALTPVEDAMALNGPRALAALRQRDVSFIFLESFGAVLYDHPRIRPATEAGRVALQQALAASGRQVVSGFFRSPVIGGASDLAHLSLLSGVNLSDPRRHDLLLTTGRPTLMHLFRQAGYQAFGLYHAVSWPWPEHVHYGFDYFVDGPALGYAGPPITFWKIPDQIALARFDALYPRTADSPPRVLFFPTITSHFPFNPVPPYQPDWTRAASANPFDAAAVQAALAQPLDWLDMGTHYVGTVNYVYRWLAGHFRRPEPRETVYVLIGDHQPTANITGEGVPWDVPVHIVSRDPALLERFRALGFTDGLWPERTVLGELNHLHSLLLTAFGGAAPAP
jgi:hypothetical protein